MYRHRCDRPTVRIAFYLQPLRQKQLDPGEIVCTPAHTHPSPPTIPDRTSTYPPTHVNIAARRM